MTERETTVPAATGPLPTIEQRVEQFRVWFEGHTDEKGEQKPGLLLMVGELYGEMVLRRERKEALVRAVTSGSILAIFGVAAAWLKDHVR